MMVMLIRGPRPAARKLLRDPWFYALVGYEVLAVAAIVGALLWWSPRTVLAASVIGFPLFLVVLLLPALVLYRRGAGGRPGGGPDDEAR